MNQPNSRLMSHEKNAKFFYHGTSKTYLQDQIKKHGRYQHDRIESGIFLSTCQDIAKGYACDRTICFAHEPIVIISPATTIIERVHEHPTIQDICIDFLLPQEFSILSVSSKEYEDFQRKHRAN